MILADFFSPFGFPEYVGLPRGNEDWCQGLSRLRGETGEEREARSVARKMPEIIEASPACLIPPVAKMKPCQGIQTERDSQNST